MLDEKWEEICEMIEEKLDLQSRSTEPDEDGHGATETLIFRGPQGNMKLSRSVRGRFVGEKAIVSKRIGGDVQIEKEYSDTETVDFLQLFRQDPESGEWVELQLSDLGLSSE
ncbi:MAG: hypothetical protein H6760_03030 [Candidatus Nomurabacteria bacterium]|nr:MAG: hypothetical protein H6760_03030 [Candidatus Nomurabacteria bacterium]